MRGPFRCYGRGLRMSKVAAAATLGGIEAGAFGGEFAHLEGDIARYLNGLTIYDNLQLSDLQAAARKYLTDMTLVEVVVD